ncbi:MAG: AI-2E family transporter [bacterium]
MKKVLGDSVIKLFISIIGIVFVFAVLKELQHIFIPLVIAYFLFFCFSPLNNFLTAKKFPLWSNIIINILLLIGGISLIGQFIFTSFSRFSEEMPYYIEKLNITIIDFATELGISEAKLASFQLTNYLAKFDFGGLASGIFSSTIDIFSAIFFVLFFFIFINGGHDRAFNVIKKRFVERNAARELKKITKQHKIEGRSDEDTEERLKELRQERELLLENTFRNITEQVQKYIITKAAINLSMAGVVSIVLALFGVDFIFVWAVLTFVFNFIPNIGSIIGVLLPAVMCLLQFGSVGYAALLAAILIVFQNLIGNIVEPKIFGNRLGINPIVILFSLLLWGYIWGIVGMILSVPITAVLKIIFDSSESANLKFFGELMGN